MLKRSIGLCVAVLVVGAVSACLAADEPKTTVSPAPIPVILDTDIGDDIDDTWALVMLLKSPQFDVKLITTTRGMAEYRAKLIAKLLTVAKRTDIPIGLGEGGRDGNSRQQPWVQDYKLTDYPGKVLQDGVGAIIDTINQSAQPITVIAIGPLDTMAGVVGRDPQVAAKALFVGMQGSVRRGYDGNSQISPEWNVKCNPVAAKKAISAPWKHIAITPLDTCGLIRLSGDRFNNLKRSQDPCVQALLENYRIWAQKASVDELQVSSVLFDTVAIYLANSSEKPLLTMETLPIIVTDDGFTRISDTGQKMDVAIDWKDIDGFCDLLVKTLVEP